MATVRWKDKADIVTLAATDRMPVTDDVGASNVDKYCTPAEIQTFVFSTAFSLSGKLTGGANEIEGSNFDINGGFIDGVAIGFNVAATYLKIDNILINSSSISTYADNNDINITPHGTGSVVIPTGDLKYAGTVVTATGAEINLLDGTVSQVVGINENHAFRTQDITNNTTLSDSGRYLFNTTGGAIVVTLPQITSGKSEEFLLIFGTDAGTNVTIVDNGSDSGFVKNDGSTTGTSITFDTMGDCVFLKSPSAAGGYWMIISGYSYTLA